jgi:D-sedoheptulose 7-phosphate isomerase
MYMTYLDDVASVLTRVPPLDAIADALWATYQRDGTIFVCGNGGSAATASHFVCDLQKWTVADNKRRVRAIALTDNMPLVTAWSNDKEYEWGFVEQFKNLYRPGDTLIAISASGQSINVVRTAYYAHLRGCATAGLTGGNGGKLYEYIQHALIVPSDRINIIEDCHSAICHALADDLRKRIEGME